MSIPQILRYVILVPHRDSLNAMEDLRKELFGYGFLGAYSFPLSAPLLRVSSPFSINQLKEFASMIKKGRKNINCNGKNMLINSDELSFYGPALDLYTDNAIIPVSAAEKVIKIYNPVLFSASIINNIKNNTINEKIIQNNSFSFRSACLRNLSIKKLGNNDDYYSYEWKMGKEVWLKT